MNFLKKLFGGLGSKSLGQSPKEKAIGCVTHYFDKIGVAIIKFNKTVSVGESVRFHGATTDFSQAVDSMQYDHKDITSASKGEEVGIKVKNKVREGDAVYAA